jgi:hypothetical protein
VYAKKRETIRRNLERGHHKKTPRGGHHKKIKPQKEAVKRNLERRSLGKIEKKKGQKIERMGERKGEKEPEKHNTKARGRRNKEE